jgi:hypothetical protein
MKQAQERPIGRGKWSDAKFASSLEPRETREQLRRHSTLLTRSAALAHSVLVGAGVLSAFGSVTLWMAYRDGSSSSVGIMTTLPILVFVPLAFVLWRFSSLLLAHNERVISQFHCLEKDQAVVKIALRAGDPKLAIAYLETSTATRTALATQVEDDEKARAQAKADIHRSQRRARVVSLAAARKRLRADAAKSD